eukprot:Gb_19497 [translate_table: standard]
MGSRVTSNVGLGLKGEFPSSLQYYRSMTDMDLSSNALSGTIPSKLCEWIPYLFSQLNRLKELNVADNKLSGVIPAYLSRKDPSWFQNNLGLCGAPLNNKCNEGTLLRGLNPLLVSAFILYNIIAIVSIFLGFRCTGGNLVNKSGVREREEE